MSFRLGLTGSIGMGKSTTAALFAQEGCAVWDADAAVHRLYAKDGLAVRPVGKAFPDALEEGAVSRTRLKQLIAADASVLPRLESIVHPLVRQDRERLVQETGADIVVFDIPLLFETGAEAEMDATVCVTVPPEVQRARVLDRGTMTEADLDRILARQMPNEEKCRRADHVIQTDTLDHARDQVRALVAAIRRKLTHA